MAIRKLQIYLREDQYELVRRRATAGKSMAEVVREAIDAMFLPDDVAADSFVRHVMAPKPGSGRPYSAAEAKRALHRSPKGPGA
jgi:hypothetical protein